jgi:hypothetical protein
MVRRLVSVAIVLATLLFAGAPAFACAAPAASQDCCPNGPSAPCRLDTSSLAPSDLAQPCCIAGIAGSVAIAADDASADALKFLKHSDIPVVAAASSIWPSAYVTAAKYASISAMSPFSPPSTLLYLSTGRLRL